MKINNISCNQIINKYNSKVQGVEEEKNKKHNDIVEISSLGRELSSYEVRNKNNASVEKLNRIKKMIESGTYDVDSKLVASKMIDVMKNRDV